MRLHAYLVQAVFPGSDRLQFAQLPGIKMDELTSLAPGAKDMDDFVQALEEKQDERMMDVQIAMEKWGRIQIVDAAFNGAPYVCYESWIHLLSHSYTIISNRRAIGDTIGYCFLGCQTSVIAPLCFCY